MYSQNQTGVRQNNVESKMYFDAEISAGYRARGAPKNLQKLKLSRVASTGSASCQWRGAGESDNI